MLSVAQGTRHGWTGTAPPRIVHRVARGPGITKPVGPTRCDTLSPLRRWMLGGPICADCLSGCADTLGP
jgi:hypothetical protein